MPRKLPDGILKSFCRYTQDTEVPSIYSLWCGISAISCALGRKNFIDMGHYTIYPNMYIILVAGSGKCKKTTAIGIAEKFIKELHPKVKIYAQKATPEAMIGALSQLQSDEESSMIKASAEGIVIADELATLINKTSTQSGIIEFLTTLYDAKDSFVYETRSRGKETISNSCVSLLGGSTMAWIKEAISLSAIGGGFTARVIFVYKDTPEKYVLRTRRSEDIKRLEKDISHDLNEVSKIRGSFTIDEESWSFLEREYLSFMQTSPMHNNKYLSGYANKRTTSLFKLCMIVSASMRDDRIVNLNDANIALKILKHVEQSMPKVMVAIAADDSGILNTYVTEVIKMKKVLERKELLNIVHHRMQAQELDVVLSTLEQAGIITRKIQGKSDKISYIETQDEKDEKQTTSAVTNLTFTERILKGEIA